MIEILEVVEVVNEAVLDKAVLDKIVESNKTVKSNKNVLFNKAIKANCPSEPDLKAGSQKVQGSRSCRYQTRSPCHSKA